MTTEVPAGLKDLVSAALREMLDSVPELAGLQLERAGQSEAGTVDTAVASVLGFTGERMNGSLVVACDDKVLFSSHPNHAMGMPVDEEEIIDWAGEVTNQMLGRIKNKLASLGVKFAMSTPTTVMGKKMQVKAPKDGCALELLYAGDVGKLVVHFLAVSDPGLDFSTTVKEETAREGDSFLF